MNIFKPFVAFTALCGSLLLAFSSEVQAKSMASRLGVGFVNQFANSSSTLDVPALSVKYGISQEFMAQAMGGVNTLSPGAYTVGVKLAKNLFYETNLNFYTALGFALVKGIEKTGVEFLALIGAEFFIPGIESLGLSFESGVSVNNAAGSFALKTVGFSFLHAGMHFYF